MTILDDKRAHLAGLEKVMDAFGVEQSLEDRIHLLGVAAMCLLNAERIRLVDEIALMETPMLMINASLKGN